MADQMIAVSSTMHDELEDIDTIHIAQLTCVLLYAIPLGTWEKVISLLKHIVTVSWSSCLSKLDYIIYKKYNEKLTLLY